MPINTSAGLTQLSALNTMASYLGIPPIVSTDEIASDVDFILANTILNEITTQVLNRNIGLNSEYNFKLAVDVDGSIPVPSGALSVEVEGDWFGRYVERDGKLWDKKEQTFVINNDALLSTIVWNFTFESLPEIVKRHITTKSALRFVARAKGEASILAMVQEDQLNAEYEFMRYVNRNSEITLLDNSTVQATVGRYPNISTTWSY